MFSNIKTSLFVFAVLFYCLALPAVSSAQLSSSNYQVDVYGVGSTNVGTGTSTNYTAEANIGPDFEYDETVVVTTSGGGGGGSSSNDDTDEDETAEETPAGETGSDVPPVVSDVVSQDPITPGDTSIDEFIDGNEAPQAASDEQYILEERRVVITDRSEYLSVTESFGDGTSITMGVQTGAVLDSEGNPITDDIELEVILRIKLLPPEYSPTSNTQVVLEGGKIFELKVVDQFGTEYHRFNPPLDVIIDLPTELRDSGASELYFYDDVGGKWILVLDTMFTNTSVSFQTNHLTIFGIWGGDDAGAEALETKTKAAAGDESKNVLYQYWWALPIILGLLGWLYSRRRNLN